MAGPGPRNLITDVPGILVGQAEDRDAVTGATVVLGERPAVAAVDVRGGAPGSRETDLLDPGNLVGHIDAVVLSGGSAFGLDAAGGVMERLAAAGRGFPVGNARVPIVPAAILFDLGFPGRRPWAAEPPHRALGKSAVERAGRDFALGNHGAGIGTTAGALKGGVGSASLVLADGITVGAVVAVNSWGSAVRPDCGRFWAADLAFPGEIDDQPQLSTAALDPEDFSGCGTAMPPPLRDGTSRGDPILGHTTLAVVATDAALDKAGCRRLAIMAQTGLAHAIRPAHTPFDGDIVFTLATGDGPPVAAAALLRLGSAAAHALARAIMRGLLAAEPLGGIVTWRQRWGGG